VTLSEQDRNILIVHRVEKARSLFKEASFLFESGLYNTSVNRIYYGMYHILSALALKDNFSTSKHLQLIGWFNREYVKKDRVSIDIGRYLSRAFEMRSKGDYDDFIVYTKPEVEKLLRNMKDFIDELEKLLQVISRS
jgi:uncharacterized protein (UPF0332 family)